MATAPADATELVRRYASVLAGRRARPPDAAALRRMNEVFAPLVGDWRFVGWVRGEGARRPIAGVLRCAFSGDGAWLYAHYQERLAAGNPRPSASSDHWGIEGDTLVRFGFGAADSGFFGTTTGWQARTLTWDGRWYGPGGSMPATDLIRLDTGGRIAIDGYTGTAHEQVAGLTLVRQ